MKTFDINNSIIDGYIRLLTNLSPGSKLDLISKLTLSVKSDIAAKKKSFFKAFGAWDKNETSEELTGNIRESRTFYRKIEKL